MKKETGKKSIPIYIGKRPRKMIQMSVISGVDRNVKDRIRLQRVAGIMFRDELRQIIKILSESENRSERIIIEILKSGLANLILLSEPVINGLLNNDH